MGSGDGSTSSMPELQAAMAQQDPDDVVPDGNAVEQARVVCAKASHIVNYCKLSINTL